MKNLQPAALVLTSTVVGTVVGAIVASAADDSKRPVLTGALTGGAIYFFFGVMGAISLADDAGTNLLSGPPQPLRFRGFP